MFLPWQETVNPDLSSDFFFICVRYTRKRYIQVKRNCCSIRFLFQYMQLCPLLNDGTEEIAGCKADVEIELLVERPPCPGHRHRACWDTGRRVPCRAKAGPLQSPGGTGSPGTASACNGPLFLPTLGPSSIWKTTISISWNTRPRIRYFWHGNHFTCI